jgi:hypothetical protein
MRTFLKPQMGEVNDWLWRLTVLKQDHNPTRCDDQGPTLESFCLTHRSSTSHVLAPTLSSGGHDLRCAV